MRCSSSEPTFRILCLIVAVMPMLSDGTAATASDFPEARQNLLVNGDFEDAAAQVGTVPRGWRIIDENFGYFGWIAPRLERVIGEIGPRTGRYMIGLDTEELGVDTNGKEYEIARAAIFQTLTVPGRCRGTFSIYYNDLGSSVLSHIAAIRLAYTLGDTELGEIVMPDWDHRKPADSVKGPNLWSQAFYRVGQHLPFSQTAVGDWSYASIPVNVETDLPTVKLTLWIGIFDNQNSSELGYYRIDDAAFVLDGPATQPAP